MSSSEIIIRIANERDIQYTEIIIEQIAESVKENTGICKRSAELINQKIKEGNAVIAVSTNFEWAGFCYIQEWDNGKFVSSCGLIVSPHCRKTNVARKIKEKIFELAVQKYPSSKLFGLT